MEFTGYRDPTVAFAVDFVNTFGGPGGDPDQLTDAAALKAFMERRHASYPRPITESDLEAVRALRARLREVFVADQDRAVQVLNELLEESESHPRLTAHGGEPWHLHFASEDQPIHVWLGAYAAMGLAMVVASEGFDRLKVCQGDRCEDVFVDRSKNRSRRFCSAEVCGNRSSVAAYRKRQRHRAGAAEPDGTV